MRFHVKNQARGAAILVFAILAAAFIANAKDSAKKLSNYDAIIVEPVVVVPGAAKNFPAGFDAAIRARMGDELRKKKLFQDVQDQFPATTQNPAPAGVTASADATSGPNPSASSPQGGALQSAASRIILSATVEQFSKGSMAARSLIGFGAGESRITLHFVLRDSASGTELMEFDQKATWNGDLSFTGGTPNEAARGVADNAVKGLIREIQKNR
jgi:hypothetical protein